MVLLINVAWNFLPNECTKTFWSGVWLQTWPVLGFQFWSLNLTSKWTYSDRLKWLGARDMIWFVFLILTFEFSFRMSGRVLGAIGLAICVFIFSFPSRGFCIFHLGDLYCLQCYSALSPILDAQTRKKIRNSGIGRYWDKSWYWPVLASWRDRGRL